MPEHRIAPEIVFRSIVHSTHDFSPRLVLANEAPERNGRVLRLVGEHDRLANVDDHSLRLSRALRKREEHVGERGFDEGPRVDEELILGKRWSGGLREGNGRKRTRRQQWSGVKQ